MGFHKNIAYRYRCESIPPFHWEARVGQCIFPPPCIKYSFGGCVIPTVVVKYSFEIGIRFKQPIAYVAFYHAVISVNMKLSICRTWDLPVLFS